jgi:hypothetical protein
MPGVVPFLPAILGVAGMVDANVNNKATLKNAENAQASAQAGVKQNQASAMQNLQANQAANPGPAGAGSFNPAQASYSGAQVPLAGTPAPAGSTSANAGGAQLPPAVLQILASLGQSGAKA